MQSDQQSQLYSDVMSYSRHFQGKRIYYIEYCSLRRVLSLAILKFYRQSKAAGCFITHLESAGGACFNAVIISYFRSLLSSFVHCQEEVKFLSHEISKHNMRELSCQVKLVIYERAILTRHRQLLLTICCIAGTADYHCQWREHHWKKTLIHLLTYSR